MSNLGRFRLADVGGRGPAAAAAYKTAELTLRALRDYHRHEAFGFENIPREGPAIVVGNHSFATYDSWLLAIPMIDEIGRIPRAIGDRFMLRMPGVGPFFRQLGFIEGSREEVVDILKGGDMLALLPGGMRESLRSSKDKYRIDWRGRFGFIWASLLSGAPIVLVACPRGDDIYSVADLAVTRRFYERFKVPLALVRGLGPTLMPRPVKLWHLISEPIEPSVAPDRVTKEDVEAHHALVCARMERLMKDALEVNP